MLPVEQDLASHLPQVFPPEVPLLLNFHPFIPVLPQSDTLWYEVLYPLGQSDAELRFQQPEPLKLSVQLYPPSWHELWLVYGYA